MRVTIPKDGAEPWSKCDCLLGTSLIPDGTLLSQHCWTRAKPVMGKKALNYADALLLFPFLLCLNPKPSSLSESCRHIWDSLLCFLQCGSIKFPLSALYPCRGRDLRKGCGRFQAGTSVLKLQLHFSVSGSSEPLLPEVRHMRVEGNTRMWFLERSQAQNQIINDCLYSPQQPINYPSLCLT